MSGNAIDELAVALREFARARDWEKFHTPKNLAMALMVEAAEVAEHFQWTDAAEPTQLSPEKRAAISLELADTFIYLLRLADRLGVDLLDAARTKMEINAARHPVDKVFGKAVKYTDLGSKPET